MLVIRMQRTGRKGHAQFRVVVQDSRRTPTSGRVVAALGHFDPHTKKAVINKEKTGFYLEHGAQPSSRAARVLEEEGIKLPKWIKKTEGKKRSIRNAEKLRKNRPEEPAAEPAPDEPKIEEAPEAPELKEPEAPPAKEEKPAEEPEEKAEPEK